MLIGMRGSCVIGDNVYFALVHANGLCSINLKSYKVSYVTDIPQEEPYGVYLYGDVQKYEDKLILSPICAKGIPIYDIKEKTIDWVKYRADISIEGLDYPGDNAFYTSYVSDHTVWFVPAKYPAFMCLNMDTQELFYIDNWLDKLAFEYDPKYYLCRWDVASDGQGKLYCVSLHYRAVICIDIIKREVSLVRGGKKDSGGKYACINRVNDGFLLNARDKQVLELYDLDWNLIKKLEYEPNVLMQGPNYVGSIRHENLVFFVPYRARNFLIWDEETEKLNTIWISDKIEGALYLHFWMYDNRLYCYRDFEIDVFDLNGKKKETIPMLVGEDFYVEVMKRMKNEYVIMGESEGYNLPTFCKII